MLGLNLKEMAEYTELLILMGQSQVAVLIALLMLLKFRHPTARMVLSVVAFLEQTKVVYWLVVMLMV